MFRIVVTGSRDWRDAALIRKVLSRLVGRLRAEGESSIRLAHGVAGGADQLAAWVATKLGLEVVPYPYPRGLGKRGGPVRNRQMLDREKPQLVIGFLDLVQWERQMREGRGSGTLDCLQAATERKIEIDFYTR